MRETHTRTMSFQYRDAELFLNVANSSAENRLPNIQVSSCAPKPTGFSYGYKVL